LAQIQGETEAASLESVDLVDVLITEFDDSVDCGVVQWVNMRRDDLPEELPGHDVIVRIRLLF